MVRATVAAPRKKVSEMSNTPNADRIVRNKLKEVNRLKGITTQPDNIVLVTIEDVIEIYHELQPYTMQKLDEVGHNE